MNYFQKALIEQFGTIGWTEDLTPEKVIALGGRGYQGICTVRFDCKEGEGCFDCYWDKENKRLVTYWHVDKEWIAANVTKEQVIGMIVSFAKENNARISF